MNETVEQVLAIGAERGALRLKFCSSNELRGCNDEVHPQRRFDFAEGRG